jgi:ankyrin repeat protein
MKQILLSILMFAVTCCAKGQTLADALLAKDTTLAATLISKGADPNELNSRGNTALMEACHFANMPMISFLLRHGATPDEPRSPKGRTALMVACAYWCGMDAVKLLVEKGADVNATADDGTTPLMLAAMNEKQDVVDYLLARGSQAAVKDAKGQTALDYARKGKVEEYMTKSIKDTRFNKEAVIASLEAAIKK